MDAQTRHDSGISYNNHRLQNAASQTFSGSSHQALSQALGTHVPAVRQNFQNNHHRLSSGSPSNSPILSQNDLQFVASPQSHAGPSNTRSPLHQFSIPLPGADHDAVAAAKRKQVDGGTGGPVKRRREGEENGDDHENHESGLGAKHWTDEEKSRLFNWLMAPDHDDHWSSLRAAKNSCLRECAAEVFGNKKTYQALKGCYERNFNVFRQIYAYQTFSEQLGPIDARSEGDRIREYERRLQDARKSGCDVGGVNARTIDHWHRSGWYTLFYDRWNGDPATTARVVPRQTNGTSSRSVGAEEGDGEEDLSFDPLLSNGPRPQRMQSASLGSQNHVPLKEPLLADPNSPKSSGTNSDQPLVNVTFPHNMMATCLQLLQAQSQQTAQKLEYMRRREEREERESRLRKEADRVREERDAAEWEYKKQSTDVTQRSKLATEILANPGVDPSVKQAAGDYLKRLFTTD